MVHRLLDKVVAAELVVTTVRTKVVPYIQRHNLKLDNVLLQYIRVSQSFTCNIDSVSLPLTPSPSPSLPLPPPHSLPLAPSPSLPPSQFCLSLPLSMCDDVKLFLSQSPMYSRYSGYSAGMAGSPYESKAISLIQAIQDQEVTNYDRTSHDPNHTPNMLTMYTFIMISHPNHTLTTPWPRYHNNIAPYVQLAMPNP